MTPIQRLQRVIERSIDQAERDLELVLDDLAEAQARALLDGYAPVSGPQLEVAKLVSRVRALGEISGRMAVRWPESRPPEPEDFAAREDFLGDPWTVAFDAAIADLKAREPVGAYLLAILGKKVSDLYGPHDDGKGGIYYPHGIGAARAATDEAAKALQKKLVEGLKRGKSTEDVAKGLARSLDWSRGYSCFVPGTLVEGDFVAGSKARYDGPIIEIQTNDGRDLAVTVNHPVLTSSGWKSAGSIQQGDKLICYGPSIKPLGASPGSTIAQRRAINNYNTPARVEDVFESLFEQASPLNKAQRPVLPQDFHGDAAFFDGQVDHVRSYGLLTRADYAERRERFSERALMESCVQLSSLARASVLDLGRLPNMRSYLGLVRRFHAPLTCLVAHVAPSRSIRFGLAADMNPSLFESLDKRLEGDVDLARNLIQAFPGVVSIHNVVNVNRSQWAGHVYDLQTKSGWIVSQGIVTSNCMVVRTNYATATSAGRFREAEEVQASGIPTGFRYVTAGDSNVRPGHAALDGLVASVTDPIWMRFSPPGGFQCRCTLQVLVGDEVPKRHVRVPAGAQFEPGFGTRADLVHYG